MTELPSTTPIVVSSWCTSYGPDDSQLVLTNTILLFLLIFQLKQIQQTSKEDSKLLGKHVLNSCLVGNSCNYHCFLQKRKRKKGTEKESMYPIYTSNTTQISCKQGLVAGHFYRNCTLFPLGNC